MHIQISAQHFALGEALKDYIDAKLSTHIVKYTNCATGCDVHFSRINHQFQCEIVLHSGVKLTLVSQALSDDAYDCFDVSLAKLDKQLMKQSSKSKDHHQGLNRNKLSDANLQNLV